MKYSIIEERNLLYGVINRLDDFKNFIGFDKPCLMEYSMSIVKMCILKFLKNVIFGELHILKKILPYGVLHANVIYFRYEVLQKYHILRAPSHLVNFTTWSTPYICKQYDIWIWSIPDKRLIFVIWSTPYNNYFFGTWSTP